MHREEVWNLKQELAKEQTGREADQVKMEKRLAEEMACSRDNQVKVEQLVAQLELSSEKINRLNLE